MQKMLNKCSGYLDDVTPPQGRSGADGARGLPGDTGPKVGDGARTGTEEMSGSRTQGSAGVSLCRATGALMAFQGCLVSRAKG